VSLRFAVVSEAPADFLVSTDLADRVFLASIEWLESDQDLIYQREWIGELHGQRLSWKHVKSLAIAAGITAIGRFQGQPGEADARAARRAITYLSRTIPDLAGVVLIRDQDNQPTRRTGLEQARQEWTEGPAIVIGLADLEREAWILCGFEPENDEERRRLGSVSQDLGFDPCGQSHHLQHRHDHEYRSPKRVLRFLSGGVFEREQRCWRETPLSLLRERGAKNGLRAYLDEVRTELAPQIGRVSGTRER
jgi:hypothetical protein